MNEEIIYYCPDCEEDRIAKIKVEIDSISGTEKKVEVWVSTYCPEGVYCFSGGNAFVELP